MDGQPAGIEEAFALDANPTYRVDFFTGPTRESSVAAGSSSSEQWQLVSASNVHEALAWAQDHSKGRGYVLYAEWRHLDGYVLLSRLAEDIPRR
jgi:hypothetical protein